VNAVVGVHQFIARAAVAITGWSLTASGAEWWLAPIVLVAGWIGLRLVFEIAESRSACGLTLLAGISYALAAAGALGWSITALGASADALAGALPLVGHTLILAALMVYARYVVLDVQGLIEHKPRRPAASAAKARKPAAKTATPAAPAVTSAPAAKAPSPQPKPAAAASTAAAASWSEADEDDEDESAGRRLSKAERKRLRKLRQGRAA
jgi:hypothetical protein